MPSEMDVAPWCGKWDGIDVDGIDVDGIVNGTDDNARPAIAKQIFKSTASS